MRVSAAYAWAPTVHVRERDAGAERAALERLAAWACQYTSLVNLVPPAALLLEVSASGALFGGLTALLDRISKDINGLGYRALHALAPTALGALWLARSGIAARVTEPGALFSVLAQLPLQCLELDSEREARLTGMGLTCIADCLRLPRDGLARRAGPEIVQALDRAFGRLPDMRAGFVPPAEFRATLALPAPVDTAAAVLFPLHRLLGELIGLLSARAAGVQRFTVMLYHAHRRTMRIDLDFSAPTRDSDHVMTVMRERLQCTTLTAPVEEVGLTAAELRPLGAHNLDFFSGGRTPAEARSQLIERLQARLGTEAVHGLDLLADHRPERTWRFHEPGQPPACSAPDPNSGTRPLWLLPEPVLLGQRGGMPWLRGALILEDERERIESGWWDGGDVARDYFIARDAADRCFWIFRELHHPGRWFLHGVFS